MKFSWFFMISSFLITLPCGITATAYLVYRITYRMSTTFFNFFELFIRAPVRTLKSLQRKGLGVNIKSAVLLH